MTTLTMKQRAKVNAALCIIHDHGLNAQTIADAAGQIIASGHPAVSAYEQALNAFAQSNPMIGNAIGRMIQLVEASSPATVTQYDQALSQYISTGDGTALRALSPMIARDGVALAIHNGEMTEAEAKQLEALTRALGFDPGDVLQQAYDEAPAQTAPTPAQPVADPFAMQMSSVEGPGLVAPKASNASVHYSGFVRDTAAPYGQTPAMAREAARAQASSHGRAIMPTEAAA